MESSEKDESRIYSLKQTWGERIHILMDDKLKKLEQTEFYDTCRNAGLVCKIEILLL
jgi:hypothetical protein